MTISPRAREADKAKRRLVSEVAQIIQDKLLACKSNGGEKWHLGQDAANNNPHTYLEVQGFGKWNKREGFKNDAYSEGGEDYDLVLAPLTQDLINSILKPLIQENPTLVISWDTSERSWMTISVSTK